MPQTSEISTPDDQPQPRKRAQRRPKQPNRLEALPLELLHLIISHLPLSTLSTLSLVSPALRAFVHSPQTETLWLLALDAADLLDVHGALEAPMRPVEMAWLTAPAREGWCRTCGKYSARKVDFSLRVRLCAKCWDEHIIYEGPDEPDPAFEEFFPGTKRYTPRSRTGKGWKKQKAFFLHPTLFSTSTYLASLLAPQRLAYSAALKHDPLAELDDFLAFSALPVATQRALDERAEWVRRVGRDGKRLKRWEEGRREAEREERRRKKRELEWEKTGEEVKR